jgi:hypothetical protein
MAYPGDPSGPPSRGGTSFVAGRLTPDDFEQLAAAFRPSWEFDEAPFTGPGSMSPSELHALQGGGGTHADVRVAAPLTNGVHGHAIPKPTAATAELQDSVIVDRALTTADIPLPVSAPAPTPAPTPFGPPVSVPAPALVAPARPASPDRLAQTRIVQRPVAVIPLSRDSTGSFDVGKGSKRSLWIAIGVGVFALGGIGIWQLSGSPNAAAPPAPTVVATPAPTRPPPDIPPPPETTAATPPSPVAQVPKTVPVSALAQVPTPVQTSAPPARTAVAPSPPPAPAPRPVAPAPKPAARPKAGGGATIVHDVPF